MNDKSKKEFIADLDRIIKNSIEGLGDGLLFCDQILLGKLIEKLDEHDSSKAKSVSDLLDCIIKNKKNFEIKEKELKQSISSIINERILNQNDIYAKFKRGDLNKRPETWDFKEEMEIILNYFDLIIKQMDSYEADNIYEIKQTLFNFRKKMDPFFETFSSELDLTLFIDFIQEPMGTSKSNLKKAMSEKPDYIPKIREKIEEDYNSKLNRMLIEDLYDGAISRKLKFKLTMNEEDTSSRLNLSSTTVCTYALSQYLDLWRENGITYKNDFKNLMDYYIYIVDGLNLFINSDPKSRPLESTDEFSLLNILSFLKLIQCEIWKTNKNWKYSHTVIEKIVRKLVILYNENELEFRDNAHPFIYYSFLCIINDWQKEIQKQDVTNWKSQEDFRKISDNIYHKGKYEMYRQMALHRSNDRSLFDVKRLIYSLLIVTKDNRYSNNNIKNHVLKTIFDEQFDTGLWSVGNVVNNDFVLEKGKIKTKSSRVINISPILSSIECLNDMLLHEVVFKELKRYQPKLDKTYQWIIERIREETLESVINRLELMDDNEVIISMQKESSLSKYIKDEIKEAKFDNLLKNKNDGIYGDKTLKISLIKELKSTSKSGNANISSRPFGWYPEYEGTHEPKSWVAAHSLIFLLKYCEILSDLIRDYAGSALESRSFKDLDITWEKLIDTYDIKNALKSMIERPGISNPDYCSAFIFGPPGTGKSTISKALAAALKWDYIEITPGQFLEEGEFKIIKTANYIFKRINVMKNTVIFFDEVDQFVELRKESTGSSSKWIVTSLLPQFQELRKQKDIKFILATNHITKVDSAMMRSGRIDFVLPMGSICWKDRLKILKKELRNILRDDESKPYRRRIIEDFNLLFDSTSDIIDDIEIDGFTAFDLQASQKLARFLSRTDFILFNDIQDILKSIRSYYFSNKQEDIFETFFGDSEKEFNIYINRELEEYYYVCLEREKKFIRYPPSIRIKVEDEKKGIEGILNDNCFSSPLLHPSHFRDFNNESFIDKLNNNEKFFDRLKHSHFGDNYKTKNFKELADRFNELIKVGNINQTHEAKDLTLILNNCIFKKGIVNDSNEGKRYTELIDINEKELNNLIAEIGKGNFYIDGKLKMNMQIRLNRLVWGLNRLVLEGNYPNNISKSHVLNS